MEVDGEDAQNPGAKEQPHLQPQAVSGPPQGAKTATGFLRNNFLKIIIQKAGYWKKAFYFFMYLKSKPKNAQGPALAALYSRIAGTEKNRVLDIRQQQGHT